MAYGGDFEELAFLSRDQINKRKTESLEFSSIDETLIRYAGVKSPQEISDLTGIPAEDVLRRIHEVLNSIDILSIEQMRAKMVIMLLGFIAEIDARRDAAVDRNFAAMANAVGGNISRVLKELEDTEKRTKLDIEAINRRRAHELVEMLEKTYDKSIGELAAMFPQADLPEIETIFRKNLMILAAEYDLG